MRREIAKSISDTVTLASLSKGLALLLKLREIARPMGLSEIARTISLKKASVYRILVTLERHHFVERTESKKYQLGVNAFYVGSGFPALHDPDRVAAAMKRVVADTKHSLTLSVLQGSSVLYIARIDGLAMVRVTVEIGSLVCAYASASGKAMLAQLSDKEVRERFKGVKFQKLTPRTVSSVERLIASLKEVRARGFAVNDEEREKGLCALGVPVKNVAGRDTIALAIAYPAGTFDSGELEVVAKKLRFAANEIESLERIGSFGNSLLSNYKLD